MSENRTLTVGARTRITGRIRLAAFVVVGALAFGPASSADASGVTVTDLDSGATATNLAQSLAGGGVTISNVTYTGSNRAAGSFTGGTGNVGFASGVALASGKVQTKVGDGDCEFGVEGPNSCNEDDSATLGGSNSNSLGTAGDAALDALVTPNTTEDAAVLEFDFTPTSGTVDFSYVFSSEEYNDFANSEFNDVFAFFVNGTNCALVPGTSDPVSINTINNGNPDGDTTPHNAHLYRDNVRPTPGSIDSQMDGLTTVLNCHANVTAGATNHIKLAIADASDSSLDSAVFIQAGSFVSGHALTVAKNGTGTGTVTSSPAGIDCGATCTHTFTAGTMVTLTPTANTGSVFAGWSGACSGTGSCVVTMDQARSVTATFNTVPTHTLTVTKDGTGTGTVTSSPAGIDCGATCSAAFNEGTMVTLTPTATAGSTFAGWSGACSGTGSCVVTMDMARSVTATFNLLPSHTLTVSKNGTGAGTVTSSPAGIDCGATCSAAFVQGTMVTLTPTAAGGSTFAGWGGACSGTGSCVVTMDQARSVTATFNVVVVVPPTIPPLTCDGKTATIVGTGAADVLKGTKSADVIVSLGGKDKINARGGNDTVCAGDGKDHVVGGGGNDDEFGEAGNDHLIGNKGNDTLNGGAGTDKCLGGAGSDGTPNCEK
jgi:Fe-S cluster biogenesis protein NfuA